MGGLRGHLIKGSYLAHAKKNNNCCTLKDRNAIQEENKIIKTNALIILAHILSYRSLESKLFVTLNQKIPEDTLSITDFTSHFRWKEICKFRHFLAKIS